ncbi:MAG: hypothetical protein HYX75_08015 [Acidobacteria bacterium]|nr:hypothetical protein [Acidobacteriota bacterium]
MKQAVTYYYENSTNQWKMCMNASGWSKMVYNLCSVSWSQATTGYYYVDNYVSGYAAYSTRDLGIGGRYSYSTSLHSTSGNGSITVCKDSWHTVDAMSSTKTYVDLGASDVNGLGVYCETASDSR